MFSLRILLATMGVTLILLRLGEAATCKRTPQDSPGCPFNLLESQVYPCHMTTFTSQQFSFYVRPGNNFGKLTVTLKKQALFFPSGLLNFEIGRDLLPSPDKWYLIKFSRDSSKSYFLHIDGRLVWTKTFIVSKTSSVFLSLNGSLYFASQCNPVDPSFTPTAPGSHASTPGSLELANASSEIRNSDSFNNNLIVNIIIILSASAIVFVFIMCIVAVLLIKFSRKGTNRADRERCGNINCNTVEASVHVNTRNTSQVAVRNCSGNEYITKTRLMPTSGSAWSDDIAKGTSNVTEEPVYEEVEPLYDELDENFSIRVHI